MQSPADRDAASSNPLLSQHHRFIILRTALAETLVVERMQGGEAINQDLRFTLDCVSTADWVDISTLVNQCANLQLVRADGQLRLWECLITRVQHTIDAAGLTRCRIEIGSWLSLLNHRRNTEIFQDRDALQIAEQVLAHCTQAKWRHEVTQPLFKRPICTQYRETDLAFITRVLSEEGLSFRLEHGDAPQLDNEGLPNGSATLVIFDRNSFVPEGDALPFARIDATDAEDAINCFIEQLEISSDAAATSRWNPALMRAVSGLAQRNDGTAETPSLPQREIYDAAPPHSFSTTDQASLSAGLMLDAARLHAHLFEGQGSVRTLQPAVRHTLTGHFILNDQTFICLRVQHTAVNNLGAQLAKTLGDTQLEAGSYRNQFTAIAATTPIVSSRLPRPVASGAQTARVVGNAQQTLTSTRDHQVRVQFYWQRGEHPLHGGLRDDPGHAPGDESSGTWLRVAEDAAGNNFGQHFLPRIGTEVLVGFSDGDIDQPTVIGQVYGGNATPPFAAGVDASSNHPGTVSGMQTRTLDGSQACHWQLDDASGQLRHELWNATAQSRLALGYLIEQQGADRGAYCGEGFISATEGWGQIRATQGLLLSATRRKDAVSTQLDIAEAHGQLQAAADTAERLDMATRQSEAGALGANATQRALIERLDPTTTAHHPAQVNGQPATQPTESERHGGDPVPCFNDPHILLETPSHLCATTPNSSVLFAGEHLHLTTQQDTQISAGQTIAGVCGDSLQWFTAAGGAKVFAHQGNVSLQASTNALEIIADQSLTLTATDDCIELTAKDKIVLQSGTSSITLQGGDIAFACDGAFKVRGATHPLPAGEHANVTFPALVDDSPRDNWVAVNYRDALLNKGIDTADYEILQEQSAQYAGRLKPQGDARHERISARQLTHAKYQEDPGEPELQHAFDDLHAKLARAQAEELS